MELEHSLLCLQQPVTGPYPELETSSPQLFTLFHYDPV
jgi:hypothetical protein